MIHIIIVVLTDPTSTCIGVTGVVIAIRKRSRPPAQNDFAASQHYLNMFYMFGGKTLSKRAWKLVNKYFGSDPKAGLPGDEVDEGSSTSGADPTDTVGTGTK